MQKLEMVLESTINNVEALWDKLNSKGIRDYNDDFEKILEPLYAVLPGIEGVPEKGE